MQNLQHLQIGDWSVWIEVAPCSEWETLEFTLHAAEERNGKLYGFYADELRWMLEEEFKPSRTQGVEETSDYGCLSVRLSAETLEELQAMLPRADAVVARWANRFNIARMKPA